MTEIVFWKMQRMEGMADRRKAILEALEHRLTGPKRIALFGHRNVGKTTLLAMFYRQASTGRVPGVRLAALEPSSAEYLAEKIARIEAGESLAGTLSETELKLRLYHGPARLDLIVKDYQGEHVSLGADEPIQAFFADCDAVLLCLDPNGSADPVDRQRRQQEVESLLERYIDRSDDATIDRPVALLITKYDQVLDQLADPEHQRPAVEQVAEAQYGMTCHALAVHAPRSAIFGVSAYGPGASHGRPPAELHPIGLGGPLTWVAEQLEASDREQLDWLWDLATDDLTRLSRCVNAYEKRYPKSGHVIDLRRRLSALQRLRVRTHLIRGLAAAAVLIIGLAGYDAWGYHAALAFERENPAPMLAHQRWRDFLNWHRTVAWFWPRYARQARAKMDDWTVRAAAVQVANGTDDPNLPATLNSLKDEAPTLAPAIQRVEVARDQRRHDQTWRALKAETMLPDESPEVQLSAVRAFLREFPETPHRDEVTQLVEILNTRAAERQAARERQMVDDLARAEGLPNVDLRDLIDQARQFLNDHPESGLRGEVERRLADYVRKLDERDIERARQYSRQYATNFATRIDKYQDYLRAHQGGGRFISEATEAKDEILREWDLHVYRRAYDHLTAHPDDVAEVAKLFNAYLLAHPDGRFTRDAQHYLEWWNRVSTPGSYRVVLRRGEVEPEVGKYLAGGGPDLCVELWVAGVKYGPSPVIPNSHRPIWDYTFSAPIAWKLGDPVTVRIIDRDWSDSVVYTLNSRKGDPLAIRLISGTIKPTSGGRTSLVFASDFSMPTLTRPE
jgi:GTPase SAR1 family protein